MNDRETPKCKPTQVRREEVGATWIPNYATFPLIPLCIFDVLGTEQKKKKKKAT